MPGLPDNRTKQPGVRSKNYDQRMRGRPSCSQIFGARRLSISPCRGTGAFTPVARFEKMLWRLHSRARVHPCRRRWSSNSWRFTYGRSLHGPIKEPAQSGPRLNCGHPRTARAAASPLRAAIVRGLRARWRSSGVRLEGRSLELRCRENRVPQPPPSQPAYVGGKTRHGTAAYVDHSTCVVAYAHVGPADKRPYDEASRSIRCVMMAACSNSGA